MNATVRSLPYFAQYQNRSVAYLQKQTAELAKQTKNKESQQRLATATAVLSIKQNAKQQASAANYDKKSIEQLHAELAKLNASKPKNVREAATVDASFNAASAALQRKVHQQRVRQSGVYGQITPNEVQARNQRKEDATIQRNIDERNLGNQNAVSDLLSAFSGFGSGLSESGRAMYAAPTSGTLEDEAGRPVEEAAGGGGPNWLLWGGLAVGGFFLLQHFEVI